MSRLRFGTDGVRAVAHTELTLGFVRALGAAAAQVLGPQPFYIGRDTRESGAAFEQALAQGLADAGVSARSLGVAPTPAVAALCAADDHPGAMISASHNPWTDNGIKLFAAGGSKLSDREQDRVQSVLDEIPDTEPGDPIAVEDASAEISRYEAHVVDSLNGRRLDGARIVIDCANGAASAVAPTLLRSLGVDPIVLHASPDGRNINEGCGSTHLADLQAAVIAEGADFGLAFDGDADRVLAVDHEGTLVDGDEIIGICAIDRQARSELVEDTVVVTVMTNLGFRIGMRRRGIKVVDTAVGDRYVLEALDSGGWNLGGEQSGHVIFRDLATTGDGLLTAVQLLDTVRRRGRTLRDLADDTMRRLPQVLENVRVGERPSDLTFMAAAIAAAEADLGESGRVLVRTSGTEPLVRVMVEAEDIGAAQNTADRLVAVVREARP